MKNKFCFLSIFSNTEQLKQFKIYFSFFLEKNQQFINNIY